jgi:hypothetical protein
MNFEVEKDILDVLNKTPDLNPLDFYFRGHLNALVYLSSGDDVESLKSNCGRFSDTM